MYPFSYKLGLVRTLVDRIFKINNTWAGFHLDINNLTKTLRKNSFPSSVIENVVRKFLNNYFTPDSSQSVARKDNCLYFKLPYIGPFSIITQRRIKKYVLWYVLWLTEYLKSITWAGFHLDINNLTKTLRKNSFPSSVIENVVRNFLNNYFTPDSSQSVARKDNCLYFKLPYIGPFSIITQRRIKKLVNTLCSDLEIKLVFTPFKIKSWFGAKDPIPAGLRSRVIYKFSCAGCSACYIGETNRHFATRIREHLASDKNSHIFKHLRGSVNCGSLCSEDCFKILDSASTSFQLKIKEAMHILWEQPSLNSQVKHLN